VKRRAALLAVDRCLAASHGCAERPASHDSRLFDGQKERDGGKEDGAWFDSEGLPQ